MILRYETEARSGSVVDVIVVEVPCNLRPRTCRVGVERTDPHPSARAIPITETVAVAINESALV